MVGIEVEAAVHGENGGVYCSLDHQISVVLQVDAAVKHADVPVVAGAGLKPGEQAMEEQKFEAVAVEDGDKHVEEALPAVHMVENKRLLLGTGCMAELVEARVVALQPAGGTGGGVAVSASCSGSHSHSLHRAHSVLQGVARVETPATVHYKARVVEHAAVGPLQTTNLSSPADLVEVGVGLEARAAAEAYNLESAEMDFCSLVANLDSDLSVKFTRIDQDALTC